MPALLLALALAALCCPPAAADRGNYAKQRLADIPSLTFRAGRRTTSRRGETYPQLQMMEDSVPGAARPTEIHCENRGRGDAGLVWDCEAIDLPLPYALGRAEVSCEGWDGPGDEYIVGGSCMLRYEVVDNPAYADMVRASRRRERNLERAARYEERAAAAAHRAAYEAEDWARDVWARWLARPWWMGGWDDFQSSWPGWGAAGPETASALFLAWVIYRILRLALMVALGFFAWRWLRRIYWRFRGVRPLPRARGCAACCADCCCDGCAECCGACCEGAAEEAAAGAAGAALGAAAGAVAGAAAGARPHYPPRFFGPRWFYPHSGSFYFNQACGCPACREYYAFPERRAYHAGFWGRPGYDYSRGPSAAEVMAAREVRRAEAEARRCEREARRHEREAARLRRQAADEREDREREARERHASSTYATTSTR